MTTKEIDLDFVNPDKECSDCDPVNNYVCFDHEEKQVRNKYPKAVYNDDLKWKERDNASTRNI